MNEIARAISNPTEIWMTVLTLLFSALCLVLWNIYQSAKKETEQRWANNDNVIKEMGANNEKVIKEMRNEMKEIANVAYTAKANATITEERRKNVEEKIEALMDTNRLLVSKIDALMNEMQSVKTAVAVNEAKQQQTSGTRRRSTNN